MAEVRCITYSAEEKAIVRKGTGAIREVLLGPDNNRKLSLLFALDWFMDPYFQQDISDIKEDLKELLQTVVVSSGDYDVSDDALNLLISYTWPPFPILEQNLDRVPEKLKADALYAINMEEEIRKEMRESSTSKEKS
ncbi:hypothetical protein [Flintibacter muris]|uniref:hypothetical protein n=1 Tax=Flintibacter muris TaxID=2941327 RepID=UPI00203E7A4F|nr:hypothetical protein [Flintibacter muris]